MIMLDNYVILDKETWNKTKLKDLGVFYRGLSYSKENVKEYGWLIGFKIK